MADVNSPIVLKLHAAEYDEPFLLDRWSGREAISELFEFDVEFRVAVSRGIELGSWIAKNASVEVHSPGQPVRWFHGVLSEVAEAKSTADHVFFTAKLVPNLWWCTQNVCCRIYQGKSVPFILEEVLREAGVEYLLDLSEEYLPHNYCVQYLESDFDFLSRLMEEEGIWFCFTHDQHETKLLVTDKTRGGEWPRIPFDAVEGGYRKEAKIYDWRTALRARPLNVRLRDRNFQRAGVHEVQSVAPAQVSFGSREYRRPKSAPKHVEVFEYPAGFAHQFDEATMAGGLLPGQPLNGIAKAAQRSAKIRLERQMVECMTASGAGNVLLQTAGSSFVLTDHPRSNGEYQLLWIEHVAVAADAALRREAEYSNRFAAIPASVLFRPERRTPKPRMLGAQTAEVVGAVAKGSQEASCDRYGRVKVKFHWDDRSEKDLNSSCWVRVSQPWAGDGFGAVYIPRIGQEVIVAFEDGDPDCPIITGSVYNSEHLPPANLPGDRAAAGFVSRSKKGGDGAETSHLLMVDQPGHEQIHLHSQRHIHLSAEKSIVHVIGYGDTPLDTPLGRAVTVADQSVETVPPKSTSGTAPVASDPPPVGVAPPEVTTENWGFAEVTKIKGNTAKYVTGNDFLIVVGLAEKAILGFTFQVIVASTLELRFSAMKTFNYGVFREKAFGAERKFYGDWVQSMAGDLVHLAKGRTLQHTQGEDITTMFRERVAEFVRPWDDTEHYHGIRGAGAHWFVEQPEGYNRATTILEDTGARLEGLLTMLVAGMLPTPQVQANLRNLRSEVARAKKEKYTAGASILADGVDVVIGARNGGKIILCADDIEFCARRFTTYSEDGELIRRAPEDEEREIRTSVEDRFHTVGEAMREHQESADAFVEAVQNQMTTDGRKDLVAVAALAIPAIAAADAAYSAARKP